MERNGLILLGAYLLGSLPFSYWMVRLTRGIDVRSVGSGNAGATNVLRAAGKGPAILALVLDALKGTAAVLLAEHFTSSKELAAWCCLAAVLGHMYPWLLRFRGGKGVATAAGALGRLMPGTLLIAVLVFVVAVGLSRWVSLGSILAAVSFPVAYSILAAMGRAEFDPVVLAAVTATAAMVIWKHRANLGRLLAGTESRLGKPS